MFISFYFSNCFCDIHVVHCYLFEGLITTISFYCTVYLFISELLCSLCIGTGINKEDAARRHNCIVIKGKLSKDTFDDSYNDPNFQAEEINSKSSDSTTSDSCDIYSFVDESESFNPFENNKSSESCFNPFESVSPSDGSNDKHNPPDDFNPFATSTPNRDKPKESTPKICPHCDASFTSSYNTKQHMISVHRIFPPGMTIYKCSSKSCAYATGSRAMFSRHSHAKIALQSQTSDPQTSKPKCLVCGAMFYNTSSLKRHITRKGHQ